MSLVTVGLLHVKPTTSLKNHVHAIFMKALSDFMKDVPGLCRENQEDFWENQSKLKSSLSFGDKVPKIWLKSSLPIFQKLRAMPAKSSSICHGKIHIQV